MSRLGSKARGLGFCLLTLCFLGVLPQMMFVRRNQSSISIKPDNTEGQSSTKFVIFLGLEGTGHHLVTDFTSKSPTTRRLEQLGLIQTQRALSKTLYNRRRANPGLLNAHCASEGSNKTRLFDTAVGLLQTIANETRPDPLTVAVNCIGQDTTFSYPSGRGREKCFNYPNVELFYHACNQAGVKCEHVYLHRDPYSVLLSTTVKRTFNRTILKALHLYTLLLNIIHAQISSYPNQNAGCLGFFDSNDTQKELWGPVRDIFGWQDRQLEFNTTVQEVFHPPAVMTDEVRMKLVTPESQAAMDSMIRAHESLLSLCREQRSMQRTEEE